MILKNCIKILVSDENTLAGQARSDWMDFETTHLDFSHHEIIFKTHTHTHAHAHTLFYLTRTCTHILFLSLSFMHSLAQTHAVFRTHTLTFAHKCNGLIWRDEAERMNKNQFLWNSHEIVFSFRLEFFFFNFHKI
jgi:hypothetical protein